MKAQYISGSGAEGTAAIIEIDGEAYECMDCTAYGRARAYKRGDILYVAFQAGLLEKDRQGKVEVGANPEQRKALESLGGWRYRAYGLVVADEHRTVLDCGAVSVDLYDPLREWTKPGEFIVIEIQRLDCWRAKGPKPKR